VTTKVKLHDRSQLGVPRAAVSYKIKGYDYTSFVQLIKNESISATF